MSDLLNKLEDAKDRVKIEEQPECIVSPVRSAKGNIRNVARMGDAKFRDTRVRMMPFQDNDPEGWAVVEAEWERRSV